MNHKTAFAGLMRVSVALLAVYLAVAYQMSLWGGEWQTSARVMIVVLGCVAGFGSGMAALFAWVEHGAARLDIKDDDGGTHR